MTDSQVLLLIGGIWLGLGIAVDSWPLRILALLAVLYSGFAGRRSDRSKR